ncbi:hypothetical protein P9222_04580 [Paenibacillus amylolyticus]|nr:hypothetical protein [Paenibacillus amylolyticus]WFR63594.1 hypothetical protein P9222_04580 [Paenibacillus amylolyticus]
MKLIPDLKQQIEVIIGTTLDEYEITIEEWTQSVANLTGVHENSDPFGDEKSVGKCLNNLHLQVHPM